VEECLKTSLAGELRARGRIQMYPRMAVCVRLRSYKIVRATLAAQMLPILPVRMEGHGAMWRRRQKRPGFLCAFPGLLLRVGFVHDEVLEASAAETAWNFCAPVVDYGGLRKEVAATFANKVVEVQGIVARLQKTQRAAEITLDKCVFRRVVLATHGRLDPQKRQVRENVRLVAQSKQCDLPSYTLRGPGA
jgi:hypothetical protein